MVSYCGERKSAIAIKNTYAEPSLTMHISFNFISCQRLDIGIQKIRNIRLLVNGKSRHGSSSEQHRHSSKKKFFFIILKIKS